MKHGLDLRGAALLTLTFTLLTHNAHAAMYRCPAPHGEGSVITNLMRESDANERECEPLQARRSSIDAPPREDAARTKNRAPQTGNRKNQEAEAANRFSDEWVSSATTASSNAHSKATTKALTKATNTASKTPHRAVVAADSTDLKPVDPGRADPERRISREAQRERDTDSRKIIQTELSKSQNMVEELRKQVAVLGSGTPEHQRLLASLGRHSVDVDSLKSELARMR
jgi:hypothetical protein